MYNLDRKKLESIIGNSSFSSDSETNKQVRNAFMAFFKELCTYSESVNNAIIKQSATPNVEKFIPEVCVALMDKKEGDSLGRDVGLSQMADTNGVIFVNADHNSLKEKVGDNGDKKIYIGEYVKNGKAFTFEYSLRFNRSYVERQELLYKYSQHYAIINPVVYSPYNFKAFDLVYDKGLDGEELDFLFKKNNLDVVKSDDIDLFWNICLYEESKTYDAKVPYGDSERYIFEFKKNKNGNYLLPLPRNNQSQIFDIEFLDDSVRLTTSHDMDDFFLLEPLEVDVSSSIVKALISNNQFFSNKNTYKGIVSCRLISEADIEHALSPFRDKYGIKCRIAEGRGNIVKRYSQKYRPNRNGRKIFNTICREYVSFSCIGENMFLLDYINYVLEYLEFYYPEIEWVGEI